MKTDILAAVNMDCASKLRTGVKVRITGDGDGADGVTGVVGTVFRSGRCTVWLPDGGFRNLPPVSLEIVE